MESTAKVLILFGGLLAALSWVYRPDNNLFLFIFLYFDQFPQKDIADQTYISILIVLTMVADFMWITYWFETQLYERPVVEDILTGRHMIEDIYALSPTVINLVIKSVLIVMMAIENDQQLNKNKSQFYQAQNDDIELVNTDIKPTNQIQGNGQPINNKTDLKTNGLVNQVIQDQSVEQSSVDVQPMEQPDSILKGFIFMNLFCICNTMAMSIFKYLIHSDYQLKVSQLAFARNFVNLAFNSVNVFCLTKDSIRVTIPRSQKLLALRSMFGTIGSVISIMAIVYIPISLQMIIFQTNPFWTTLICCIVLKSRISYTEIAFMLVSFCGVLTIALSESKQQVSQSVLHSNQSLQIGGALSLCLAWSFASMGTLNRMIPDVSFSVIMFYHSLLGSMLTFSYNVYNNFFLSFEYFNAIGYLLILGSLCDTIGLASMTIAYQSAKPSVVSLIGQLNVVYGFFADLVIFQEQITYIEMVGTGIILMCTIGLASHQINQSQQIVPVK